MDHPALPDPNQAAFLLAPSVQRQHALFDRATHLIRLQFCPAGFPSDDPERQEPGYLFLGRFHPMTAHSDMDLATYLMTPPVPRRAWYYKALGDAQRDARTQGDMDLVARLALEEQAWLVYDDNMLDERIRAFIEPDGDHWIWKERTKTGERPTVNWRGVSDVPVYVLLWPRYRRHELLEGHRPRKLQICPDVDKWRRCVNPMHFKPAQAQLMSQPRRTRAVGVGKPVGRPTGSVRWRRDHTNHLDQVLCPDCDHPLGTTAQQQYQAGYLSKVAWCRNCASLSRRISEGALRTPRGEMLPTSWEEDEMMQDLIRRTGGYGGGYVPDGQVVPPEPEPIKTLMPPGGWDDI